MRRSKRDNLFPFCVGFIELAHPVKRDTAVADELRLCVSMRRAQRKRAFPIRLGLFKSAHHVKNDASIIERIRIFGVETDGLVLHLERFGELAQSVEGIAEVQVSRNVVRGEGYCAPKEGYSLMVPA